MKRIPSRPALILGVAFPLIFISALSALFAPQWLLGPGKIVSWVLSFLLLTLVVLMPRWNLLRVGETKTLPTSLFFVLTVSVQFLFLWFFCGVYIGAQNQTTSIIFPGFLTLLQQGFHNGLFPFNFFILFSVAFSWIQHQQKRPPVLSNLLRLKLPAATTKKERSHRWILLADVSARISSGVLIISLLSILGLTLGNQWLPNHWPHFSLALTPEHVVVCTILPLLAVAPGMRKHFLKLSQRSWPVGIILFEMMLLIGLVIFGLHVFFIHFLGNSHDPQIEQFFLPVPSPHIPSVNLWHIQLLTVVLLLYGARIYALIISAFSSGQRIASLVLANLFLPILLTTLAEQTARWPKLLNLEQQWFWQSTPAFWASSSLFIFFAWALRQSAGWQLLAGADDSGVYRRRVRPITLRRFITAIPLFTSFGLVGLQFQATLLSIPLLGFAISLLLMAKACLKRSAY